MKDRFKMSLRIALLMLGVVYLAEAQANTYNVVDRFQLLEDKFRTQEMLREFEHNFIFDVSALANTDVLDFVDDAEAVADTQGTSQDKIDAGEAFLLRYDKTEQNARVGVGINIPIFSFKVKEIEVKPSIRAQGNLSFLMGIQSEVLSASDLINLLGSDIPPAIKTKVSTCINSASAGADLVQYIINTPACGLTEQEKTALASQTGKYFKPSDPNSPIINNYIKGEARVGAYFDYKYKKNWFGTLGIYGLYRTDFAVRITADSLAGQGEVAELPDELNSTTNFAIDYRLGYRKDNWMAFAAIEDLKLARLSDNEEEAGALLYGEDALIRLHGEYLYKLSAFSVKPFVGLHKRSSYDIGDGYYLGADLGAHIWEERIGLRVRGMIDSEHFTFSPMAKLWLVHVEYMLRQPITSEVDGVKPATIHSLNFRIDI